jgi:hypothetical protein
MRLGDDVLEEFGVGGRVMFFFLLETG